MKKLSVFFLALFLVLPLLLSSCKKNDSLPDDDYTINIKTLAGPTGMGMAKLMEDSQNGKNYVFTVAQNPQDIQADIVKGDFDIAALPINLASALYEKTNHSFKIAAINTLGVLYILENGDTIKDVKDLAGKTVFCFGQGSTPEYTLRYILKENSIDPDSDIDIQFVTDQTELTAKMASSAIKTAMLPEPSVSAVLQKNNDIRIALDITKEWDKVSDQTLFQGCIVVNNSMIRNHPDALKSFLDDYKASVEFIKTDDSASSLVVKHGIIPNEAVAKSAIPNSNICYIDGEEMKSLTVNMLEILYAENPKSIGGKLPDENFYYQQQK